MSHILYEARISSVWLCAKNGILGRLWRYWYGRARCACAELVFSSKWQIIEFWSSISWLSLPAFCMPPSQGLLLRAPRRTLSDSSCVQRPIYVRWASVVRWVSASSAWYSARLEPSELLCALLIIATSSSSTSRDFSYSACLIWTCIGANNPLESAYCTRSARGCRSTPKEPSKILLDCGFEGLSEEGLLEYVRTGVLKVLPACATLSIALLLSIKNGISNFWSRGFLVMYCKCNGSFKIHVTAFSRVLFRFLHADTFPTKGWIGNTLFKEKKYRPEATQGLNLPNPTTYTCTNHYANFWW